MHAGEDESVDDECSGHKKRNWAITYGTGKHRITAAMLKEWRLIADECHSTNERVNTYTYFHLKRPVRETTIDKFLDGVREAYGIIPTEIFAYDTVGSISRNGEFSEHVVMKMLAIAMRERKSEFVPWTDGKAEVTRGLLKKMMDADMPKTQRSMTKSELMERVAKLETDARQAKQHKHAMDRVIGQLVVDKSKLKDDVLALKTTNLRLSEREAALESELSTCKSNLEQQREKLKDLQRAEAMAAELGRELSAVKAELGSSDQIAKITALESELSTCKSKLDQQREKLKDLRREGDATAQLEAELKDAVSARNMLSMGRSVLETDLCALKQASERQMATIARLQWSEGALEAAKQETQQAKKAHQEEVAEWKKRVAVLEAKRDSFGTRPVVRN